MCLSSFYCAANTALQMADAVLRHGVARAINADEAGLRTKAKDFAELSKTKLTMPLLTIGGDKSLGEALGQLSQKVVDESNELSSEAGNSSSSGAQQFQSTMAEFQADSQTLSMLSNAFATAIKSIGEGMQTMASKQ